MPGNVDHHLIDEPSDVPVNSVRMGKSGDNTEAGRTGDDYNGMERVGSAEAE